MRLHLYLFRLHEGQEGHPVRAEHGQLSKLNPGMQLKLQRGFDSL